MKFYCDACNTKYSIPDEKVQGKVLKVRCKSCGNVITVKEQVAPSSSGTEPTMMGSRPAPPPPPQGSGPSIPPNNWHYSVNGQSAGPYTLKALRERFASGSLGDEAYVWHETLVAWKPVREVPPFHDALARGQSVRPRAKTVGFTGPLEAIKVDSQPKGRQGGEVPTQNETVETPRPKTDPPGVKKTPELKAKPIAPEPREDRLEKLREKLKHETPPKPTSSIPKLPEAEPKVPKPAISRPEEPKLAESKPDVFEQLQKEDTAKLTSAPVEPEKPVLPSFELKPFSATLFEEDREKEESSDPLESWASEEPDSPEDSGLIPFFDDAPKLGPQSTEPAPTGSLLLQLDSIKKEGRGKKFGGIAAGIAVLIVGVSIGVYLSRQAPEERPIVAVQTEKRVAPVEKVYSKKQLTGLGIELEEEVLVEGESDVEEEPSNNIEQSAGAAQSAEVSSVEAKSVEAKSVEAKSVEAKSVEATAPVEKKTKSTEVAKVAPKQVGEGAGPDSGGPVTAQSVLNYSNATAVQRSDSPSINRPDDKMQAQAPTTLTTESARDGFQIIRRSVEQCRARHMRRGAKLDASKISVRVTVEPSGTVSRYVLEPSTVVNTEFDLCMGSHRERWRFARWDGDATEVSSSFVLN